MIEQNYPSQLLQRQGPQAGRKLTRLRLMSTDQIQTMNRSGLPEFKPYARILDIEIAGTVASFSENVGQTEAGNPYVWNLAFSLANSSKEVSEFIRHNIRVRWVAFVQIAGGETLMVGTPEFPLTLQAGKMMGGGNNANTFQLTGSGPEPAIYGVTVWDK